MKEFVRLVVCLSISLLVSGCATRVVQSEKVTVGLDHDGGMYVPTLDIDTRYTDIERLRLASELAILSNNVYCDRSDLTIQHCDNKDKSVLLQILGGWTPVAIPDIKNKKIWLPRWNSKGMRVETWKKPDGNGGTIAAIVFRGTVFTEIDDWYSNLRWFTRINPFVYDQYDQVRDNINDIVKSLGSKVRIVATGHSLGGGLAQQAAYACNSVKEVYGFDPSPVTGYFSVDSDERARNEQGINIYRIYEVGEVLGYVRGFMRILSPIPKDNPKIVELGFNFDHGSVVKQHSIDKLAVEMSKMFLKQTPSKQVFERQATPTEMSSLKVDND